MIFRKPFWHLSPKVKQEGGLPCKLFHSGHAVPPPPTPAEASRTLQKCSHGRWRLCRSEDALGNCWFGFCWWWHWSLLGFAPGTASWKRCVWQWCHPPWLRWEKGSRESEWRKGEEGKANGDAHSLILLRYLTKKWICPYVTLDSTYTHFIHHHNSIIRYFVTYVSRRENQNK